MKPDTKAGLRKPPNRRTAVYVTLAIMGAIAFAFLGLLLHSNPQAKREAAVQAAQQKQVQSLPKGTSQDASTAINQKLADIAAAGPLPAATPTSTTAASAASSTAGLPPTMSPATLAQLNAAFIASKRPHDGQGVSLSAPRLSGGSGMGGDLSTHGSPGTFEDYPKTTTPMNAATATGQRPQSTSTNVATATYSALHPLSAPSTRILSQGSMIRAVLITGIDTRNAGNVTATVTQNVYSSLVPDEVLIPRGSRLIGSYSQRVSPGLPRIPVSFTRVILPDGRAVSLGGMQAVNYAGDAGVPGSYHSNILRALGPSLVVALIGTAIDREAQKRQNLSVQGGMVAQSPTVPEQMAPQVNQEVMSRYAAAAPYFTVPAGTAFKINTTRDIVIPAPPGATNASTGAQQAAMPNTSYWQSQP